jgi:hypothetical protein
MKMNDAFPSKYLKASDVEDEPVYKIIKAEVEEVGPKKDEKVILYFRGVEKGLVLNKTNWKAIADQLGSDDTDSWIGSEIQLYSGTASFQGEEVEAIRIKKRLKKAAPSAAPAKEEGKPKHNDGDALSDLPPKAQKYLRARKAPDGRPLTPADEYDADGEDNPFFDESWAPF